jgi:hypothetical protein
MTPLSYQGFGFTAILLMVGILSAAQLLKYLKERMFQNPRSETKKKSHARAQPMTPNV